MRTARTVYTYVTFREPNCTTRILTTGNLVYANFLLYYGTFTHTSPLMTVWHAMR